MQVTPRPAVKTFNVVLESGERVIVNAIELAQLSAARDMAPNEFDTIVTSGGGVDFEVAGMKIRVVEG